MSHVEFRFRSALLWTVLLVLPPIILGDYLFYQQNRDGAAIGIYCLALLATLLARRSAVRRNGRALLAVFAAATFAFALIFDTSLLAWAMFWAAASMATLLPAVAQFDDGWQWFQRLFLHGLRSVVAPVLDVIRVQRIRHQAPGRRIGVSRSMAVLGLPIGGSVLILVLFAVANPVLDRFLQHMLMPLLRGPTIGRMILWTLLLMMGWSLLRPRTTQRLLPTFDGRGDFAIPGVSILSVTLSLIIFNLLFAPQNIMDIAYLGGLARLPEGVTLAGYAHRGAYPLIATALLAGLFVLVTLRPGSATAGVPAIRFMVTIWIAQNIVLVASSILRTVDYIEAYSLTPLRIAALAWMVLVAIGLVLICCRIFWSRSASWLINANLTFAALFLTVACFVDLAATSAWWNIYHAREVGGRGAALDLCYLNELDDSALLPLIALERTPGLDPAFRERVHSVRERAMNGLVYRMDDSWTLRRQQRLNTARIALKELGPVTMHPGARGCDGAILPPDPKAVPAPTAPVTAPVSAPPPTIQTVAQPLPALPALTGRKQP